MRPGFFLFFLALLGPLAAGSGVILTAPALAQPAREPGVLPLDRILPGIRRDYPGNFYDADGPTPGPDGQPHYHLKWMTPDGRIEWLDTDARTGRVLGAAPGRDSFDGPGPGRVFAPAPVFPTGPGFAGRGGPAFEGRGGPVFGGRGGGPEFRGGDRGENGDGAFRGGGRGGYGAGRGRRGR